MQGADWLSLGGMDRKWPEIGVARFSPLHIYPLVLLRLLRKPLSLEPVGRCRLSGPRLGQIGLSSQGAQW